MLSLSPSRSRDRVLRWLLGSPLQLACGPWRGGVAGVLQADGQPRYVYGEVTGYWLRWAACHAPDPARMGAAVDWLQRAWAGREPPPTRPGAEGDWRNGAVFSFDLAMVLRGLAAACAVVGAGRCAEAAAPVVAALQRLVGADGTLLAQRAAAAGAPAVPARWSTLPGACQAKTAAALLALPAGWLPPSLQAAAQRTLARCAGRAGEHPELHARLYALEGQAIAGLALAPGVLLGLAGADGVVPESWAGPARRRRADVQAQALRLACLLQPAAFPLHDILVAPLLQHLRDDGAVAFGLGEREANVWCALFAHQALDWLCALRGEAGTQRPDAAALV